MLNYLKEICKPTKGSKYSAGIDLYASQTVNVNVGHTAIIPLGIKINLAEIENDMTSEELESFKERFYLELHPRSSLRAKGIVSGVGIIDIDYEDELKMIVHSLDYNTCIEEGMKVAQILLKEHSTSMFVVTSDEKRLGGLGSTGAWIY